MRRKGEEGFTLIEMAVVTAIVIVIACALGTFFLGGASPAVASADRDVVAALGEARRTALAFDAATVVFAPARFGSGYSARVYARFPGDPGFAPRNGPSYDSTVAIAETKSPLGTPGFALAIDSRGAVTGFANFSPAQSSFAIRPCPAGGSFALHLAYERQTRTVDVPCVLPTGGSVALVRETPAPAYSAAPVPAASCPSTATCVLGALPPLAPPAVAPSPAPAVPPLPPAPLPVIPPEPPAVPTACPAFFGGTAPGCLAEIVEEYGAAADRSGVHTSWLFADATICDDGGCGSSNPVSWIWGCPFGGRGGSNGYDGSNAPYHAYAPFSGSVSAMIGNADHDAAEDVGSGIVSTEDSYCAGYALPVR